VHVYIFVSGVAVRLIFLGTWLFLFTGCQEVMVNVGNVGTRENPLEKAGILENNEVWSGATLTLIRTALFAILTQTALLLSR